MHLAVRAIASGQPSASHGANFAFSVDHARFDEILPFYEAIEREAVMYPAAVHGSGAVA